MAVTNTTITPTIGLEITGMTADQFGDPQTAQYAQRALDQHGVVVYREVHLSDEQLLAFSRARHARRATDRRTPTSRNPNHHFESREDQCPACVLSTGKLSLAHRRRHRRIAAEGDAAHRPRSRPSRRRHRIRQHLCGVCRIKRDRTKRDRRSASSAHLRARPGAGQSPRHQRAARLLGPGARASASTGVDTPHRSPFLVTRCDSRPRSLAGPPTRAAPCSIDSLTGRLIAVHPAPLMAKG